MMRALVLIALVLLAACSGDRERARPAAAEPPYAAAFAPEFPDLIQVSVRDARPVTAARLVAPDGTFYEAYAIDTERSRTGGGGGWGVSPSVGVGVGGGSGGVSTGIGIGFPIFGGGGAPARSEVRSTARIRVTDMAAYRANWEKSELRVTIGEGSEAHDVVIPAPQPPAS
jgi:hypothetical protein